MYAGPLALTTPVFRAMPNIPLVVGWDRGTPRISSIVLGNVPGLHRRHHQIRRGGRLAVAACRRRHTKLR